jgi:hypothetical protein
MLIIEGIDKAGKTTLARKLVTKLGCAYEHMGIPPADYDFYWGYVNRMSQNVVHDRFHIGEYAYGDDNGVSRIDKFEYKLIQAQLKLRGCYVVVCIPGHIQDAVSPGRPNIDDKFDNEKLIQVFYRFANLPSWIHVDLYIQEKHPAENSELVDQIVENYQWRQDRLNKLNRRQ